MTVPDQLHDVVDVRLVLGTAGEDTGAVPLQREGVDVDGDRPHISQRVHHFGVVVFFQLDVAAHFRGGLHCDALSGLTGRAGGVLVVGFRSDTVFLNELVGQFGDRTLASTGAAAVIGVLGATYEVLRSKLEQSVVGRVQRHVRLDLFSRGKGPARSAGTLVLNGSHDVFFAPVNALWEIGHIEARRDVQVGFFHVAIHLAGERGHVAMRVAELALRQVGELVHVLLPGVRLVCVVRDGIVSRDLEDDPPSLFFFLRTVRLGKVGFEVLESVLRGQSIPRGHRCVGRREKERCCNHLHDFNPGSYRGIFGFLLGFLEKSSSVHKL